MAEPIGSAAVSIWADEIRCDGAFVPANSQEPNAFAELMLEVHRFHLLVGLIQQRSDIQFEQVWPKVSAAGIGVNEQLPPGRIREILGVGTVRQLEVLTAAIIKQTDENVISLRVAHDKFREAMQCLLPRQRFNRFEIREM